MIKNIRLKKLKAYSAYATAFIASQQTSQATIQYIDVDPDYDITQGSNFELDINNDNNVDFIFTLQSSSTWWGNKNKMAMVATDNPNNKVKAMCQSSSWYGSNWFWCSGVNALEQGDTIGLSLDWTMNIASYWNNVNYDFFAGLATYNSNTGYYYYYYGNQSPWLGAQSKYLGVRFQAGSNVHYGWIRLDIDDKVSAITIKDYAYNTEPFQPLLAGEKSSSSSIQNPDNLSNVALYSYGNKIKISGQNLMNATITVTNVMGQIVHESQLQNSNSEIELDEVASAYYIVNIKQQNAFLTKRLFIKN